MNKLKTNYISFINCIFMRFLPMLYSCFILYVYPLSRFSLSRSVCGGMFCVSVYFWGFVGFLYFNLLYIKKLY